MAYKSGEDKKKHDIQYIRENQSRVAVNWLKSDYEGRVKPAIKKSGMPVATFVKAAVNEKIARDELSGSFHEIIPELKDALLNMNDNQQRRVLSVLPMLNMDV